VETIKDETSGALEHGFLTIGMYSRLRSMRTFSLDYRLGLMNGDFDMQFVMLVLTELSYNLSEKCQEEERLLRRAVGSLHGWLRHQRSPIDQNHRGQI